MPTAYQAILFDFDGVLADTEPVHWECWGEVLAGFGIPFPWERYQREFVGIADRDMITVLCEENGADVEAVMAEHPRKRVLFRDRMTQAGTVPAEVKSILSELEPNYKLAVVTSSARLEIEPILLAGGIARFFGTVVYGDDVSNLKPDPEPYRLAAERLGVTRALVLEDSEAGIASGCAAGFDVLEVREQAEMVPRLREWLRG